jgi:hypothetical protein
MRVISSFVMMLPLNKMLPPSLVSLVSLVDQTINHRPLARLVEMVGVAVDAVR